MPRIVLIAFFLLLAHWHPGLARWHSSDASLPGLISKKQYEKLFPHHNAIYSYENFVAASGHFPEFAGEPDKHLAKRELIAFLANIAHETSSGWAESPGGTYAWGLSFVEEEACRDGHCTVYNTAGTSSYLPVPGKSYHGRGAMQLTYTYNYGLAGAELGLPLLENPDTVARNGVIAFQTALWFWMRPQQPKPSCHEVMSGEWQPNANDSTLNRRPGFGMTINIINGGIECNSTDSTIQSERKERIGFYQLFGKMMNVPVEADCDCVGMGTYGFTH